MGIERISNEAGRTYQTMEVKPVVSKAESVPAESNAGAESQVYSNAFYSEDGIKPSAPSDGTIKQAISDINKKINPNTIAEYGYHEATNKVTIKIVDKDTDKVIKEYPAEETLDMIAKVWELAGMFLDEKL